MVTDSRHFFFRRKGLFSLVLFVILITLSLRIYYSHRLLRFGEEDIEIDVVNLVEETPYLSDWNPMNITDCNQIFREDCEEIVSRYIPDQDINLWGLVGEELELARFRRDIYVRTKNDLIGFCKRYQDREEMLGQGTRKPVKIKLGFPAIVMKECSVPCEIVHIKNKWVKDVDVIVETLNRTEIVNRNNRYLSDKTRPYRAVISSEALYSIDSPDIVPLFDDIDLLIHFTPFADVHTRSERFVSIPPGYISFGLGKKHLGPLKMHGFVYNENGSDFKRRFMEAFNAKKKDVLALDFVSRCQERKWYRNHLLAYVQRSVKTDNYGQCGDNLVEEVLIFPERKRDVVNKAYIAKNYKFMFCMENSMSYGYISEKLGDALNTLFTLPIYSGPYFVNIADYPNPKDLVDHLLYLDRNDTAYFEYFQWRFDGLKTSDITFKPVKEMAQSHDPRGRDMSWVCRLCEKIYYGEKLCHFEKYTQLPFPNNVNIF